MAYPLGPKTLEHRTPMEHVQKPSPVPRRLTETPHRDAERELHHGLAKGDHDQHVPHKGENENLGLVPKNLNHKSPSDFSEKLGLARIPLHKRDRPMFAVSDDRVMLEKVRRAHKPDMIFFDAISLLHVADDIFNSPVPSIDGSASKTAVGLKDYDQSAFEAYTDVIEKISCEIECKCSQGVGGEFHGLGASTGLHHQDSRNTTTFTLLDMVSKYRWDVKLVLVLSALAVKYGVFLLLAQTFTTNQLTKSLAFIKHLPGVLTHPGLLTQRLEKIRLLTKDMVDITTTIINVYELPHQYITETFNDHIPIASYWTIRSALVCASQIASITGFGHDQIMSFMEISEIHENSERLRKINAYLKDQLQKSLTERKRENIQMEIEQGLIPAFSPPKTMVSDIVPSLLRLFKPIDYLYHGSGSPKKTVNISVLRQKHVLLFISDLTNLQEELYILEYIYNDAWQQSFELVWVPVLDPDTPWTDSEKHSYETLCTNMRWYILPDPWLMGEAAVMFIKQVWNFKKKPILVAVNSHGEVASKNAFPMVWIWHSVASPFTRTREKDLWAEQELAWNLEFLVDGTDQTALNSIAEGKYVCLYGGEDMEWIRKYVREWRRVEQAAGIDLELVYVGKRNPKERTQRTMNAIREEKLGHTLLDNFQVWFFWARIESMWESRQQILKLRSASGEPEQESLLQEITTLLSYGGSSDGWGIVSRIGEEMVRAKGDEFIISLTEFDEWKTLIPEKGFLRSLKDHLFGRRPEHHCTRFLLPAESGVIPEKMVCSECGRIMDKYFLYQCCLE